MSDDQSNPRVPGSDSSDVAKTHRLSRRSAIKKAAGITGGILATGAVAGGLPVVARQDSPQRYTVAQIRTVGIFQWPLGSVHRRGRAGEV